MSLEKSSAAVAGCIDVSEQAGTGVTRVDRTVRGGNLGSGSERDTTDIITDP